ncbi:VOC family protein [Azospirillum sp. TSO35-2]|uniref:VOC family protein n=1 Tax=Azospirillum sp. TSO35-2 TaxID=716796 RepID=UPI000D6221AB|nr:VOC family protein [Azospirillum sp. TSO35-2]PWC38995.1 glyoxalase [Azospirillum sp. TSO35-2]
MTDSAATLATPAQADRPVLTGVIPYLAISDAAAAAAFYTRAFGAEEVFRLPAEDGRRLMHCHLTINGGPLMFSDFCAESAQAKPQGYLLHLQVDDVEAWWSRAVAAGAEVVMPLTDMFWGDRYGQLRDPFGITWALAAPIG